MALAVDVATIGGIFDGMRVLQARDSDDLTVMRELANRVLKEQQDDRREQAILCINEYAEALKRGKGGR